jgi:hypothetical protein
MPAGTHHDPPLPVDNPTALIRSRITEKRIFEARFLCRQLGAEIATAEKIVLQRELEILVARIKDLRQQARAHAAEGLGAAADSVYREIERIAIDVPGLVEERARMEGAEPLIARITGRPLQPETRPPIGPLRPTTGADQGGVKRELLAAPVPSRKTWLSPVRLLAFGACLFFLVVAFALLFLLRGMPTTVPLEQEPAQQTILIRPLAAPPSAAVSTGEAQVAEPVPDDPVAEDGSVALLPSVSVGALQIEETAQ